MIASGPPWVVAKEEVDVMRTPVSDAEVKVLTVELVRSLRVVRMSTLIRYLEHLLGEKKRGAWSTCSAAVRAPRASLGSM